MGSNSLFTVALAVSSSMDNFAIGLSVALAGRELPSSVNAIVAICNALGALAATVAGNAASQHSPLLAPLCAAAIFGYLGYEEIASWRRGDAASPLAQSAADGLAFKLAVPMTLNNLAGGVAGGAAGVNAGSAFASVLVASFVLARAGALIGRTVAPWLERWFEPRVLAAVIFASVALVQMFDVISHNS